LALEPLATLKLRTHIDALPNEQMIADGSGDD